MEKFSGFRDPGTGIQVFLPPVPPAGAVNVLAQTLTPFAWVVGAVRAALVAVTLGVWLLLNTVLGPISRPLRALLIAVFGRLVLFFLGFAWISPEVVSLQKRGKAAAKTQKSVGSIKPEKGSIIISNWSSWIDVLYISMLFNPVFLAPVVATPPVSAQNSPRLSKSPPGSLRRRPAGAEVINEVNAAAANPALSGPSSRMLGFRKVSMWDMIINSGQTPMVRCDKNGKQVFQDLETLAKKTDRPVCIFPELVTSNNRGLLRVASVFPISWRAVFRATGALQLGAGQPQIYIVAIKHAAPSAQSPSTVLSVPYTRLNPLPHVWQLCANLNFSRSLRVRILDPDESPTSRFFAADAQAAASAAPDPIIDLCANLISQLTRLRRTGLGWEEKEAFLTLYRERRK